METITIPTAILKDFFSVNLPESLDIHSSFRVARNPAGVYLSSFGSGVSYTVGFPQEGSNELYGLETRSIKPVVSACRGDEIELVKKARRVELSGDGVKGRFPFVDGQMFPITPKSRSEFITVDCQTIVGAIKQALPSLERDDLRYPLNGARLVIDSGSLVVFTTDGFKMSLVRLPVDSGSEFSTWVSYAGLRGLIGAFASHDGPILLKEDAGSVIVRVTDDNLTRQMTISTGAGYEDAFPKISFILEQFVPQAIDGATVLEVDAGTFVSALRAVSPMAVAGDNRVLMQINQIEQLTLSTTQETGGVSALVMDGVQVDHPLRIILSARFLSQVRPRKGTLHIHVKGSLRPIVFEDKENRVLHIIAAMHEN